MGEGPSGKRDVNGRGPVGRGLWPEKQLENWL